MSAHQDLLAKAIEAKAKMATGLTGRATAHKLSPYTPKGGIESTLNGSEIQKIYTCIRDFNKVIQDLGYLESYFSVENGFLPEHYGRLIINKQVKSLGHGYFENSMGNLENLQKLLEVYLRGLQQEKGFEEDSIIPSGQSQYISVSELKRIE